MQEEGGLRGNGNEAEPWKQPPFQMGFKAFWKTGGCACRAQTPRRHQHVCLVVDVMQVWPAPPLTRMLLQEEGVGARRSTLSVGDHSCPTVLLAAGCCGFEPSSAEAFSPSPGLAWMMCADTWCFRRSPGASCNLVLSLHAPQGARAGVPVNFGSFGVGFVCAGFKGNITVTCLSSAELSAWKKGKATARQCSFRESSPRQGDKIRRSLLQTLPDKSHST